MQVQHVPCDCCNGSGFIRMPYNSQPCPYCFTLGFKSSLVKKGDK